MVHDNKGAFPDLFINIMHMKLQISSSWKDKSPKI